MDGCTHGDRAPGASNRADPRWERAPPTIYSPILDVSNKEAAIQTSRIVGDGTPIPAAMFVATDGEIDTLDAPERVRVGQMPRRRTRGNSPATR